MAKTRSIYISEIYSCVLDGVWITINNGDIFVNGCFHGFMKYGVIFWGKWSNGKTYFIALKASCEVICKKPFLEHSKHFFVQQKN